MKRRTLNSGPAGAGEAGDDDLCVLVQPAPGAAGDVASSGEGAEHDAVAPCITHVDRGMIRAYFRGAHTAPAASTNHHSRAHGRVPSRAGSGAVPQDLEEKLSVLPAGYMRTIVGKNLVLVNVATHAVIDVVADIDDPTLA
jgi:hypothetical protein